MLCGQRHAGLAKRGDRPQLVGNASQILRLRYSVTETLTLKRLT